MQFIIALRLLAIVFLSFDSGTTLLLFRVLKTVRVAVFICISPAIALCEPSSSSVINYPAPAAAVTAVGGLGNQDGIGELKKEQRLEENTQTIPRGKRIGLWVEAEGINRPFRSVEEFNAFKRFLDQQDVTDLFCQVYRGGRSWFPSSVADESPYRVAGSFGVDPLRELIDYGKRRGIRIHAWINVLRLQADSRDGPLLTKLGPGIAQVDNRGFSLLGYRDEIFPPGVLGQSYMLETPGLWLDPSEPLLRSQIATLIRELLRRYPELDGVHLDMIRFPYGLARRSGDGASSGPTLEYGYSDAAISRYVAESLSQGREPTLTQLADRQIPVGVEWDNWRRAQVSDVVKTIREQVRALNSKVLVSAAVLGWAERSYNLAFQDWGSWLDQDLIDFAVPMAYTREAEAFSRSLTEVKLAGRVGKVMVGIGGWMMIDSPELLQAQVRQAAAVGAAGVVLFSYANLLSEQGARLVKATADALATPLENVR